MTLEVYSLASGSSGNAMLVRGQHGDILLDCGMARSFIEKAIVDAGSSPQNLRAVVLTHEHTDHTRGALALARRYKIPLTGSSGTLKALNGADGVPITEVSPEVPLPVGEFTITGYPVAHDARQPLAFHVATERVQICYAVDLGMPGEPLMRACATASLVILESNHDVDRLMRGPYEPHLKARILGNHGHLSNQDAAAVITQVAAAERPIHFWLAHLSAVNNSPRAALRSATRALHSIGKRQCRVEIALRDRPSLRWSSANHWWQPQLSLEF